ncbi:RNaseH domain-containing protein [Senegalimassilia faecalis]|uniref:RNaseH domain-containing protein n=1 Tax=Senegalimassilia faecalis TaxID=2509433 RepID=UPI003A971D3D
MSDPIAAAEAAGKARDIANRFETAVFLIAYGIAEKDGLYEADPHRYPYSQAFRHGMNILAALCAECSDDAEELLPTFNESDFIRNSAASDVREWTARWRDECREAVEGCRSIEIGPLASVDGDYFAATSECYEVLRFAENDLLGGHQERRVYEFLRAGTQEQYVYGRRMLIRHPLLTWNEYVRIKTGLALGDPDPLDQGEADTIDPVWLQEFVSMAYEPVPGAAKVCPNCGWTMTMRGKQPHCSSATCAEAVTGDFDKLDSVAHDAFRLSRGVMHYISSPGKLELAIAEALRGCMVQLYKNDMRVNLPAPLHLAEQVEEYIWDWELTGRR